MKTRAKKQDGPKKRPCAKCGKFFLWLDTHLRKSAICRDVPECPPQASPAEPSVPLPAPPANHPAAPEPPPYDSISLTPLELFISPVSKEKWQVADAYLAGTVVLAVLAASTVDEKHHILCSGVYGYFSSKYGTCSSKPFRRWKHKHSQGGGSLELRLKRNKARQQLRKARRSSTDPQVIQHLANTFHQCLQQFSRARKAERKSLQECKQLRARRDCAKNFWKFAAQTLDVNNEDIQPAFQKEAAEEFFTTSYSSEPRVFHQPPWLPTVPSPQQPFTSEDISVAEIQRAIMKSK